MSNNKQSSVEWLIGEILKHEMTFFGTASIPLYIIEQAKVMHKQEMIDFAMKFMMQDRPIISFYNETFGGNNEQ